MKDVRLAAELEHALAGAAEPHDAAARQQAAADDDDRGAFGERLVERRDHSLVGDRRRREDLAQRLARHGACVEIQLPLQPFQYRSRAAGGFEVLDVPGAGRLDRGEQRHALRVIGECLVDVDVDLGFSRDRLQVLHAVDRAADGQHHLHGVAHGTRRHHGRRRAQRRADGAWPSAARSTASKHLQAIATEAEVDIDVYQTFADYAERVPLLAAVKPTGDGHIEDFEAAGGARAVLKRLERQLDLDARSVSGQTLREILAATTVADERMIATLDKPLSKRPAIVIVRGSLLPGGGIVRLGGTGERMLEFRGKANIFHSRDEALAGIKAGNVKPGDVVVLRGLGVIGGPGMAMTSAVIFALDGAGLLDRVAAITEGQLSGLVNNGLVVGEASPEAAAGGPLAFVENGDMISIDVRRKAVDLEVPEAVLAERRKTARVFGAQDQRGWLGVYQRTVAPVHEGAVLKGQ